MTKRSTYTETGLLLCGIAYPILYIGMMLFVRSDGYSWTSQTVSELSAYDAPTRSLWIGLGAVYTVLVIAFGLGVMASASRNRRLASRVH